MSPCQNGLILKVSYLFIFKNIFKTDKVVVTGLEAPILSTIRNSVSAISGEGVLLQCSSSGKPQPKIYWTKGQNRIEANAGSDLFIKSVQPEDIGQVSFQ